MPNAPDADMHTVDTEQRSGAYKDFLNKLTAGGILTPAGAPGLYDRHEPYRAVIERVSALIERTSRRESRLVANGTWEVHRFGPILPSSTYEKTDYVESFPHLTGIISVFTGGNKEHNRIIQARSRNAEWRHHLEPGDSMMVSAACHPLYAQLPSTLPAEGVTADVEGWCFRHEPSTDPFRLQSFRMRELVYAGDSEGAQGFREGWIPVVRDMLKSLGLPVDAGPANDPFFGRVGNLLAGGQLEKDLKTEFVVPVYGPELEPVAIASCNNAEDHFGSRFSLTTSSGEVASTACTAFGLDRITLALFATHGTDLGAWPAAAKSALGL
ncbi:hypothetical protein [Corynebacterium sanguinis]|uniref:hypothetical protein n=1 Tax=Corynebacterium sanguinis TaxID=2594913 RepID=UPI00223B759B|nr:hypothetical protein [Corynebacterium sanguinis]MCT1598372.1 hypothetical protein [Corynebacterium sanguinis]